MTGKNTIYVAFTTQNAQAMGWSVAYYGLPGDSKATVEQAAVNGICGDQLNQAKDIFTDTELKNLVVVTESVARRRASFRRAIEEYFDGENID